jgi:hypothetical protein
VIDSASAVIVLQSVLDQEQRTGTPPGEPVTVADDERTGRS